MDIFLLIFLGLVPSFIWLSFFLQEDIHPEPRRMLFLVFLGGGAAAIVAVTLQYFLKRYFLDANSISISAFGPVAAFAALEEICKFIFTYALVRRSKEFDEPIDAMIYMVTAASAMAAVENVAIMMSGQGLMAKEGTLVFRFLGATLLHILSSAIVGYYWAKGIIGKKELVFVAFGLVIATLMHAVFNYFIVSFDSGIVYAIVFLVMVAFFVFFDFEKLKKGDKL